MVEKTQRFLLAVLRFHGDVLLTTPMISEIKENYPDSTIDLLVYKGTGSILESDPRVNTIIEALPSSSSNLLMRIFKEIQLLRKLNRADYDFGVFLTTQWRMALMARCLRGAKTAGVDDIKRRKSFWVNSFTFIFPEVGEGHIIERNLSALETLGLSSTKEEAGLSLNIPQEANTINEKFSIGTNYCLFHPVSRRETKLWKKDAFAKLIDHYSNQGLRVVLTSGPDLSEIQYLKDIEELPK